MGSYGVTVATPWYPTPYNRMAGSFVAAHAELVATLSAEGRDTDLRDGGARQRVRVVHGLEWPGGTAAAAEQLRPAFDAVLDRLRAAGGTRLGCPTGALDRVPVFTVGGDDWGRRGEALVRDVRRVLGGFDSPVVHGHVGYLGGLLAARLADPGAKVFATEHSSALRAVLAEPQAREHYQQLLERADTVFCASGLLRDQIVEVLPQSAPKLQVMHNAVDFSGASRRQAPPSRLDRWVFVGNLDENKGVRRLVEAFVVAARDDTAVTLTMFGDGPLAGELADLADRHSVRDRLQLRGVVEHDAVLAALPDFDLLVAPSRYETFHLAVVEAVAARLPVVVTRSGGPQETLAGVEHLVGRTIDVADSPDEIVEAWRDLSRTLDRLDLAKAAEVLDARFGLAATATRLAVAYGLAPSAGAGTTVDAGSPQPSDAEPQQRSSTAAESQLSDAEPQSRPVVVLSVSGWRRYAVEAELEAARRLEVPVTVVTADPLIAAAAQGLVVVAPTAVDLGTAPDVAVAPPVGVSAAPAGVSATHGGVSAARAGVSALRRALRGRPVARGVGGAESRPHTSEARTRDGQTPQLGADTLRTATLVLGDCQSMPLAAAILQAYPQARPVVELDRAQLDVTDRGRVEGGQVEVAAPVPPPGSAT